MNNKSFEEAISLLESKIKDLESGSIELKEAVSKYKEAMDLVTQCQTLLKNAEKELVEVVEIKKD